MTPLPDKEDKSVPDKKVDESMQAEVDEYNEIVTRYGELGEIFLSKVAMLSRAILTALSAVESLQEKVIKMEEEYEKDNKVAFTIQFGNGAFVSYTCAPDDLDNVQRRADAMIEKMGKLYSRFMGEAVKQDKEKNAHTHDPEGYG